jgi:tetratricopeptide (TPR) repeat protein
MTTGSVLNDLVWACVARERNQEAEAIARRLIAALPRSPEPHRGLANILRKQGRMDEAEAAYREALRIKPEFAQARRELAALLVAAGRPDDALTVYTEAMAAWPGEPFWRHTAGRLLLEQRRFGEARSVVLAGGGKDADTADGCVVAAIASLQLGDRATGFRLLERALTLRPGHSDAHYNLGMALLEERRTEEAIEHLRAAAASNPGFALGHYNLAVAVFMAGRPAEALPSIREAIRLDPSNPDAHGFLKVVLEHLPAPP